MSRAADFAIRTGESLIAAKGLVGHGQFQDYVTLDCGLKLSTANLYMKLAQHKGAYSQLLAANPQDSKGLSQAELLRFLSSASQKRKRKTAKPNKPPAIPKSRWRWWR
jgi:hypothetical protein